MRCLPVLLLVCLLIVLPARAQEVLSPNAEPDHGGVAMGVGFTPDPLPISGVLAGGNIDVSALSMGQDCRGYVTAQPDFRINIVYPFPFLRFIFVSDSLLNDTSLVIRTPGGTYRCNDDSFSVDNPTLDYNALVMGEYAIWVGSLAPNTTAQGTLYITVAETIRPSSTGLIMPFAAPVITPTAGGVLLPTPIPGTVMDEALTPIHGSSALEHGFLPDPYWAVAVGGGTLPVPPHDAADPAQVAESECAGYATAAPQLRLEWRGISTRLRLFYIPATPADADTGLAVLSPDGWRCNRSFAPGFVDPLVEFINPAEGVYTIWVTNEAAPAAPVSGILYVTEKEYYPTFVPEIARDALPIVNGLDAALPPEQGAFDLPDNFAPDPLIIPMLGGGAVDVRAANETLDTRQGCLGYTDAAPDYTFNLLAPLAYLRLFFVAALPEGDGVLVVHTPDGRWYCNDDSYNSVHPTINLVGLVAGIHQVWVGNFDAPDALPGTLYITQSDTSPLEMVVGTPSP